MYGVGLDRSRPATSRHLAQALHPARTSGRGLLARCSITTSPVPAATMEKSMSGSLQSPGRYKAFRPSSAHAPSRRVVVYHFAWKAVRRKQMSILFKNPPSIFAKHEDIRFPRASAFTDKTKFVRQECQAPSVLREDHIVLLAVDGLLAIHAIFKRWRHRRRTLRALAGLDDRQLRDIGLTREQTHYHALAELGHSQPERNKV